MRSSPPDYVTSWAPATIANLSVGFDALGLALAQPQERMLIRRIAEPKVIIKLESGSTLPDIADENVAGVSARSVLTLAQADFGVELSIFKSVRPGSGLGSSAASAVAATVGVAALVERSLSDEELLKCALDGEELASGSRHLDNVAPALWGGVRLGTPDREMISLPPPAWWIVILHPQVTVRTADARAALPESVSLNLASAGAAWMGRFVHACHQRDARGAARSLRDLYVGPARAHLIPALTDCREVALKSGALEGGISGSGPSSFWVCLDQASAQSVSDALSRVMRDHQLEWRCYVTQISTQGAYVEV
jgi:homoserine kinase